MERRPAAVRLADLEVERPGRFPAGAAACWQPPAWKQQRPSSRSAAAARRAASPRQPWRCGGCSFLCASCHDKKSRIRSWISSGTCRLRCASWAPRERSSKHGGSQPSHRASWARRPFLDLRRLRAFTSSAAARPECRVGLRSRAASLHCCLPPIFCFAVQAHVRSSDGDDAAKLSVCSPGGDVARPAAPQFFA